MDMFFCIVFFILGLVFGSFFNVCILRIPIGEDIFISRSHCTLCKKTLGSLDMIPVFSYIFLGGKCRYCGKKISIRYPLIELLTGILFAFTYLRTGYEIALVPNLIMVSLLIIIAFIDLDHMIIPHSLTISGMFVALAWQLYSNHLSWTSIALGFAIGFGIPAIIMLFGGMGGGDAMVGGMFGIFFGLKYTFVLLLMSFLIGGIFSIYMLVTKRKNRKEMLPFGPFLALAGLIMIYYGDVIVAWYLGN